MNPISTGQQSLRIDQQQLVALFGEMIRGGRGREGDDNPLPPGPWDPVIRTSLERLLHRVSRPGDEVALNPQPLPPRQAFLVAAAQTVIGRAELMLEIAQATPRVASEQGINIVGGYTDRFSDDWCGTGFKLRWPLPGPPPHWFAQELGALDLLVIAAEFDQAATESFSPGLRNEFASASRKFAAAGVTRIPKVAGSAGYAGTAATSS